MLTPRFTLSQDDNAITAQIYAPYVKFSEGEMWLQGNEFSFYCKPYHLKLYFSGEIIEDGTESAKYEVDSGTFTIVIPKINKGERFENLDMLTKLITPPRLVDSTKAATVIEVLNSSADPETTEEVITKDIDWSVDQSLCTEDIPCIDTTISAFNYGFNLKDSRVFSKLQEESYELLDVGQPDETMLSQRSKLQFAAETKSFSADHYLADLADDSVIQEFITYTSAVDEATAKGEELTYSKVEVEDLIKLPKKEYLLDSSQVKASLLSLVDILYACCYDQRTTLEETSVESAWTIRKLSSTLSWLVCHTNLKKTLISCVRRSLSYPLYRHWVLAMKIVDDVCNVLLLGRKQVVKCLLYVYHTFNNTEPYHVHNRLYVADMCVWVQNLADSSFNSLAHQLLLTQLSKEDIQLDLMELERSLFASSDSEDSGSLSDTEACDSSGSDANIDQSDVSKLGTGKEEVSTAVCGRGEAARRGCLDSDDSSEDECMTKVTSKMDGLTL